MQLIEVYAKLKALELKYFHTRDIAAYFNISTSYASKLLSRLSLTKQIISLKHGVWVFPDIERFALPAILTAPFPAYISLQSALYYHGMISQIPETLYAVSLARTDVIKTPLLTVSIHHLQPDFFFGYETLSDEMINMAEPEKALIDILYFSDTKSKWFHALPELEFPQQFSFKKAQEIIRKIPSERKRTLVKLRFDKITD